LIRCNETPAAMAKNRLTMPDTIEFSWQAYANYFPQQTSTPASNIAGVVVDGSSKKG